MENNGAGMIPPGKYIHKSTGNVIHVRDCFQDGDSLVIMSDQGQLDMKQFSEYFQVEEGEEMYIPNLQDLYGGQPQNKNQLLAHGLGPIPNPQSPRKIKILFTFYNYIIFK